MVLEAPAQVAADPQRALVEAEAGLAVLGEVGVVHDQAQAEGRAVVADVQALEPEVAELAVAEAREGLHRLVPPHLTVVAVGQHARREPVLPLQPDLVGPRRLVRLGVADQVEVAALVGAHGEGADLVVRLRAGRLGVAGLGVAAERAGLVVRLLLVAEDDEVPQVAEGEVAQTVGAPQLPLALEVADARARLEDVGGVHRRHVLVGHQVEQVQVVDVLRHAQAVQVLVGEALVGPLLAQVLADLAVAGGQARDGRVGLRRRHGRHQGLDLREQRRRHARHVHQLVDVAEVVDVVAVRDDGLGHLRRHRQRQHRLQRGRIQVDLARRRGRGRRRRDDAGRNQQHQHDQQSGRPGAAASGPAHPARGQGVVHFASPPHAYTRPNWCVLSRVPPPVEKP